MLVVPVLVRLVMSRIGWLFACGEERDAEILALHHLRPMRGLKTDSAPRVVIRGHALVRNIRRHYELGTDARHAHLRVAAALNELADKV